MEKRCTFNCGLTVRSKHGRQKFTDYFRWQDQYKKVCCPWNSLCLIKMHEWADERRDWEGVYSWRRSVRYVYNTKNTYIQQTMRMLPHLNMVKILATQHILYKFNPLTGSTCESIYMMLCTHKNPCLFQFYGSSAGWVLVSNCNNLALKENRKQNNASTARQSYMHNPCPSVIHPYIPKWSVHCQRAYSEFDFD